MVFVFGGLLLVVVVFLVLVFVLVRFVGIGGFLVGGVQCSSSFRSMGI